MIGWANVAECGKRSSLEHNHLQVKFQRKMPELIKESDLLIGDMLGSGSFGHVYKGKWKNREVAVKFVLRTKRSEVECIDKLLALKHSHLVTIL